MTVGEDAAVSLRRIDSPPRRPVVIETGRVWVTQRPQAAAGRDGRGEAVAAQHVEIAVLQRGQPCDVLVAVSWPSSRRCAGLSGLPRWRMSPAPSPGPSELGCATDAFGVRRAEISSRNGCRLL